MHTQRRHSRKQILTPISQEHAEAVEIYRPEFEHVAQLAAVIPVTKKSKAPTTSIVKAVVKLAASGAIAGIAYTTYTQGCSSPVQILSLSKLSTKVLHWLPASHRGLNSTFWVGFGIATAANLGLTLGLGIFATSKLDVQHEFTRHPQRRPKRAEMVLPYPRAKDSTLPKTKTPAKTSVLDPQKFRLFKLSKKTLVSPNVYRFVFALPNPDDVLGLPTGQHIALRATIHGKMVQRSYTPVSNNKDLGRIELLIKVYPQGLMTNHLAGMEVGDEIDIRGPKGAMQYSRTYAKNIGMIAGGTGITPMYQLIRAICEDEGDSTQVSLLYASNSEEDILLREELDAFAAQNPKKFKFQHVLARPKDSWTGLKGFINRDMIKEHLAPATDASKVLLCGPPPMINAMKKNLAGLGWKEPGAISKASDPVFLF